MKRVVFFGIIMIISSVIALLFNILANRMASKVACDCILTIRHDLFEKTMYLSGRQVDSVTVASLESRLTSDTYNVHHFIAMIQRLGVRAPILFIGGIIVTFTLEKVLTLVMLCTIPLICALTVVISRKSVPLHKKTQEKVDSFTRIVREDTLGIRVIKALSRTEYEKARFERANEDTAKAEKKAGFTTAFSNPSMTFLLNTALTAVIVVGAVRVSKGVSGAGAIIAFMSYFTIISNALLSVSRMFIMYSRAAASMTRIDEVLSLEKELLVDGDTAPVPENASPSFIEFKNVSFSYGKSRVIDSVSFTLKKGETLGIIGPTGSGKSTLISLLMRFYDPDSGEILIDGINIKDMPTTVLRQKFGAVFQSDFLFADKISENVKFGRDVSDMEVEKALKASQGAEFVMAYEDKADHMLDIKGANLSGGQKQRLLIARALAADPEILVLDDSSSALDYKTDALLRRAIASGLTKSTVITVAQRISSIMHADLILVLENGRIIGKGSHAELLEGCPLYKEISDSQIGGAIID